MAYIDRVYYEDKFLGKPIPLDEFPRIADIASDVIYDVCTVKPTEEDLIDETFKKAVAYQVELLYEQGGIDAILGFSEYSQSGGSESLGDYSKSSGTSSQEAVMTSGGIPVSTMSVNLLRRLGLMTRWAYAHRCRRAKP